MAQDPVCGMIVDEREAQSVEFEGKTYFFCSHECRRLFERDPDRYVRRAV
jgi:Cu+-exporting ATPase